MTTFLLFTFVSTCIPVARGPRPELGQDAGRDRYRKVFNVNAGMQCVLNTEGTEGLADAIAPGGK
ncbi:hypothetical protein PR003_g30383 [Phytophthora rubi]|uniref:Uncharacterized protein n=1 Tax=Phytophthora rubi TaxID=129364 RepID=A0A6A4BAT0_9STRA|nr:hypothetical protein PR002_g29205 [Phytophthora rubi]KAE9271862.1 hypothetical protein PR003_g30383 [Phytophthora rubi]